MYKYMYKYESVGFASEITYGAISIKNNYNIKTGRIQKILLGIFSWYKTYRRLELVFL